MATTTSSSLDSTWHGTVWLIGQAGFSIPDSDSWPWTWPISHPSIGHIAINEPERIYSEEDGHLIRHRVDFTCDGAGPSLRRSAERPLALIADVLSFHSLRPVKVHLEAFSKAPPPPPGHQYAALAFGNLRRGSATGTPLVPVTDATATTLLPPLADSGVAERITRSLHWLRRAMLAEDPIVAFAHVAFALEAIAPLLPLGTGQENSPSARLRAFAVQVPDITPQIWKRIGGLRHALFHGGIEETADVVEDAAWCAHVGEYVLVGMLRHVLAIALGSPPSLPTLYLGSARDVSMTSDGFLRPEPPTRL